MSAHTVEGPKYGDKEKVNKVVEEKERTLKKEENEKNGEKREKKRRVEER